MKAVLYKSYGKPESLVMSGTGWGGFAQEVKAMASNVFKLSNQMDFETAASSMMTISNYSSRFNNRNNSNEK